MFGDDYTFLPFRIQDPVRFRVLLDRGTHGVSLEQLRLAEVEGKSGYSSRRY